MNELVLYTNPMSRGRIARWMLEEVGRPYRVEILGFGSGMKDEAYRRINPMGKVPTVVHGRRIVTECAAICAYLADAFPEAGLAPALDDRADYYRWLFFASGPLEAAVTNRSLGTDIPVEKQRMVGYGAYEHVMDALETAVANRTYIAGERFSAADVYIGAQLSWGLQYGTIEKRPAFEIYANRMTSRDAARLAGALDDADVAKVQ